MSGTTRLTVPCLAPYRTGVAALVDEAVPSGSAPDEILVDLSEVKAFAQGGLDELVGQVLVLRATPLLRVVAPSPRIANHLRCSARVRGVSERLVIETVRD